MSKSNHNPELVKRATERYVSDFYYYSLNVVQYAAMIRTHNKEDFKTVCDAVELLRNKAVYLKTSKHKKIRKSVKVGKMIEYFKQHASSEEKKIKDPNAPKFSVTRLD